MKRLLDAHGGVVSTFHYEESGDRAIIQTSQDCEAIVERNKAVQNQKNDLSFGRWTASIPLNIAQKWMQEDGVNWLALPKKEKSAYLRKKLNDPNWRHLRTSPGMF